MSFPELPRCLKLSDTNPSFRLYVIFHKALFSICYYDLSDSDMINYIRFIATNAKIPKAIPDNLAPFVFSESQLPWYDPFMQHNFFCEDSAFFHVLNNHKILLDPYPFVGFLQYDMVLQSTLFRTIESCLGCKRDPRRILFVHKTDIAFTHLNQIIGLEGWGKIVRLYNAMFKTHHTLNDVLHKDIPLFHTYVMHKDLFRKMMTFAKRHIPLLFEMLGYETRHLPFHIERAHGIFLALQLMDGKIDPWIVLPGIEHRQSLRDKAPEASELTGRGAMSQGVKPVASALLKIKEIFGNKPLRG